MAKLRAAARNKLASSSFGLPAQRKYPMPDKAHARNAKARASEQAAKGNLSESSKEKIDAMADRKLGKHDEKKSEARHHEKKGREHEQKMEHKEKRKEHHASPRHHEQKADHPTAHEHLKAGQSAMDHVKHGHKY